MNRRSAILAVLLVAGAALADVVIKNAGSTVGPVVALDCAADGGMACSRSNGVGKLRCSAASLTDPGCITTGTQSLLGTKTVTGADGGYCSMASGVLTCSGAISGANTIRYGTCPERQLLWSVPAARYDAGVVMGQLEALDPAGGRIDYLTLFDSGGAKVTDGGTTQASFLLVIQ